MSAIVNETNQSREVRGPENPLSTSTNSTDRRQLRGRRATDRLPVKADRMAAARMDSPLATLDLEMTISLALARCGLSHKQACAYMDLDESQWAKQLKNVNNAHVSMQRLLLLPMAFWHEFLPLVAERVDMAIRRRDALDVSVAGLLDSAEKWARVVFELARECEQRRVA